MKLALALVLCLTLTGCLSTGAIDCASAAGVKAAAQATIEAVEAACPVG
jgi:hypothetical protein